MKCIKCNSDVIKNGHESDGTQKYKCKNPSCRHNFNDKQVGDTTAIEKPASKKIGMTLNEFRDKHDVDHILQKVLNKLSPNMMYERNDIYQLTGLRPGYPGLAQTVEAQKKYYGKVGSVMYFSHPDTIKELKEQAKLM